MTHILAPSAMSLSAPRQHAIEAHQHRRARVLDLLSAAGGGVALIGTAQERRRNRDTEYPYRFDSHFHYLSGFAEPESFLVLRVQRQGNQEKREAILFCRAKNEEREIWDGYRYGPEAAREQFRFDAAYPINELDQQVPQLLADVRSVYYCFDADFPLDTQVSRWLSAIRGRARGGVQVPHLLQDLSPYLADMRLIKDTVEIDLMRQSAQISADAHRRAMQVCARAHAAGDLREYQLEAELLYEFRRRGAQAPAYNSIVAAGANACVLHYPAGDALLKAGELCLIDAGCELDGYAADITRTFPVNGRFSSEQRAVYDIVLAAQDAACAAIRPGANFNDPHQAALQVLVQGLIDLGLLNGSVDGAIESHAYRQFYMHRTSHWLGMDVHDVGDYYASVNESAVNQPAISKAVSPQAANAISETTTRPWRPLVAGMVLTVEPGLYLRPAPNVPARFAHIGIRIEDDALVTDTGCELLTASAPKKPDDIEALMQAALHG